MKLTTRLAVMIALAALGMLLIGSVSLLSLRSSLQNERHEQIENLLKMSIGLLESLDADVKAGKLTQADAQARAASVLGALRNGNTYLFARDANNVLVAHVQAARVGKQDMGAKLPDGRYVVEVYRDELARQGKFAYVTILTAKPGAAATDLSDKLNGVTVFEPWGWTLGTGFFTDDINQTFRRYAIWVSLLALLVLGGTVGFAVYSSRRITRQLGGDPEFAAQAVHTIASGNLNQSLSAATPGSLVQALGTMQTNLKQMIAQLQGQSGALNAAVGEINGTMRSILSISEESAETTASTAASVEEMTVSIGLIAENARETEAHSSRAAELAHDGEQQISEAAEDIHRLSGRIETASTQVASLNDQARQIGAIANEIQSIAEQTNLLALNAAIEAARAGEQGRGFAVVADEVRKLAERTARATQEINVTIVTIQNETAVAVENMQATVPQIAHGATVAAAAAGTLREINISARATLDRIRDVAHATSEQNAASTMIATNVERVARMLDDAEQSVRSTHSAVESLSDMAGTIDRALAHFRT